MKQLEEYANPEFNCKLTDIIGKSNQFLKTDVCPEQVINAIQEATQKRFPPEHINNLYKICEITDFLGTCQIESKGVFDLSKASPSVYITLLEALNISAKAVTESNNRLPIQEKIMHAKSKTTSSYKEAQDYSPEKEQ